MKDEKLETKPEGANRGYGDALDADELVEMSRRVLSCPPHKASNTLDFANGYIPYGKSDTLDFGNLFGCS